MEIEESVIQKIRLRRDAGRLKYGVSMERDDLSRLDWLRHAQAEAADFCIYLEKLIQIEEQNEHRASCANEKAAMEKILDEYAPRPPTQEEQKIFAEALAKQSKRIDPDLLKERLKRITAEDAAKGLSRVPIPGGPPVLPVVTTEVQKALTAPDAFTEQQKKQSKWCEFCKTWTGHSILNCPEC